MRRTTTILTCLAALSYATLQAQTPQDAPPETPLEAATQSETLQIVPTTTGLTVESLVHLALENNPTLAQARAETHKAYGRYVQAGLYPNPVVGYQSNEVFNGGKAGQQGLMYQQEFVRANKLELSQNVAAWSRQAAQQMLSAQEFRVANGTRQEFYAVLAARRVRELSRRLVQLTENVLTLARSRFEQAEGTRTEVLQATVERDRARLQLIAEHRWH